MSTPNREPMPDTPTSVIRVTGRIATPARVAVACIPILLMLITPFMPFAVNPTLWFGMPAVLVWMGSSVVLTVVLLNVVDASIRRQAGAVDEVDSPHLDDPRVDSARIEPTEGGAHA